MKIETAAKKLRTFLKTHRRLPSYQEMCPLFGFASKKASFDLAGKLIKAGIIAKDEAGKLIPKQLLPGLPLLGTIRAGNPSDAQQLLLDTMSIEGYLVENPEISYLLKVSGDSMIEAGINDGDMVIIEEGKSPKDGDIVVAQIDGEFTLKYFRKTEDAISLVPANKSYPSLFPKEELNIFGIVVSVLRKYH